MEDNRDYYNEYKYYKQKYLKLKYGSMTGGSHNKTTLVLYSRDSCPHCINFSSDWNKLKQHYKNSSVNLVTVKEKILDANISDPKLKEQITKFVPQFVPTLVKFSVNNDKITLQVFNGNRSIESIKEFVNSNNIQ